jgi:nucleotide-binding universal stress UspA family protein
MHAEWPTPPVVRFLHMPDTHLAAPFRRAVLGLNGGPTDPLVVGLGCTLAKPFKAELICIHVVEVDWSHDLDDDLAGANQEASAILDLAEGIAEKLGVSIRTELLQARDVGAAIVDEATELQADMIVLGLPFRKKFGGDFAMGRTVPYVLQNAPGGVLVLREPIARSESRPAEPETALGVGIGAGDRL